jgi:predicted NUDIX family NTP pyrophosphohydrolase
MSRVAAGLLLYRIRAVKLQVLLAHPETFEQSLAFVEKRNVRDPSNVDEFSACVARRRELSRSVRLAD